MTINFYLDNKSYNSKGKTIYCYIREYGNTITLRTREKVNPDFWDSYIQRANLRLTRDKVKKGELNSLNDYLDNYEIKIKSIEKNFRGKKPDTGFDIIADAIKTHFNIRKTEFLDVYDEFLKFKKNTVSKKSLLKYKRIKGLLEEYQKVNREKLNFDKITKRFLYNFQTFLIEEKEMINDTVNRYIKFFRTFILWANENNLTEINQKIKLHWEKNEVIYLTEPELMKLYDLQLTNERLARVRDIFCFQCFTGVRYSDIENLSKEDIKNSTWHLRTQKNIK